MATLEKPKSKKQKKKVVGEDFEGITPEPEPEYSSSTAACSKLVSYECAVSKEFHTVKEEDFEEENDEIPSAPTFEDFVIPEDNNEVNESTSKSLKEELFEGEIEEAENELQEDELVVEPWTSKFEASAPQSDTMTNTIFVQPDPEPIAQYPSLSSLRLTEESTHPAGTNSKFVTKPKAFTAEQMKEIYYCKELENVRQFETYFIQHNLHFPYENQTLYVMLQAFALLRGKIKINLMDLRKYQSLFKASSKDIWKDKTVYKKFEAMCSDNVLMQISESYEVKEIDNRELEMTSRTLSHIYDLLSFTYTNNLVKSTTLKYQIEDIIQKIIADPAFTLITNNTEIRINNSVDPDIHSKINNLRTSISILFLFVRKPSPDKTFQQIVRHWLRRLIALQLRLGTKEDHWFILFHILRCPSGIGDWAKCFLQIPKINEIKDELDFVDIPEINHIVSILNILLLPIKERDEFLREFWQSNKDCDAVKDERWVLVDSDGEEDGSETAPSLKESDLIALLDQIPFKMFFSSILNIVNFPGEISIDYDLITGTNVLKVIAFSSTLIDLIGKGLLTYNVERYKQFAKRLGRLMRHVLQYVSDYHDLFITNSLSKKQNICERIKVELNELFIKACSYIYRTKNLATWQYFSSLPFATLDISMVWQLFYYLNVGFPTEFPVENLEDFESKFSSPSFWDKFNDSIADSSDEDLYYLLQAFFEIANERTKIKDWDLIKLVCLHIFHIGFINERTRDICYKTSRDLLVNLTLAYNELMTNLLLHLKSKFESIENAIYLFKALPLENWKPLGDTFDILSNWLLNFHYETKENILSRVIISHLNWGFDCDGKLFLPHNIHLRMACLVSDALTKHSPEVIGSSGISESVRQVSNLMENQTTKEQFVSWCWHMISLLRLHSMDQSKDLIRKFLDNPAEPLIFIPDINKIDSIYQGVTENRPLSIYISILVSLWGHSVPLICHKGFENMKLLIQDYRHCIVIRCMQLVVPLFLECPDSLVKSDNFKEVLNQLVTADCTYLKMAKDLIYATSVGPVMELLNNMIHCQVLSYMEYSLTSPMLLIDLWLGILTSINGWHNTNVVYLIDNLLSISYQFPDSFYRSKLFFKSYYKNCDDWKVNKTSTFKMLLGSGNQTRLPVISHLTSWLSLILLEVEFETKELQVWPELLRQMSKSESKGSLDSILKKTTQTVGVPNFNSQFLVIFKYANLISTMEPSNPLFPLMCQKFFKLYLARVPLHYDEERFSHTYGVSDKFYEYNVSLMKKIKGKISTVEKYYEEEAGKISNDEGYKYFLQNCGKMMKTYLLWLEETNLNKITKSQNIELPPQYNPVKLADIFSDNGQHWTEYLHLPSIREKQRTFSDSWKKKSFRYRIESQRLREPLQSKPRSSPTKRIFVHLQSYDPSEDPPELIKEEPLLPLAVTNFKNISSDLKNYLKSLGADAHKFTLLTCEMNSLNGNYKDQINGLYENVQYVVKKNKLCNNNQGCSGAAVFQMTLSQSKINKNVQRKIEQNRERYTALVEEIVSKDYKSLVLNLESLEITVKSLLSPNADPSVTTDIAIHFFYEVIKKYNDDIQNFSPTSETCNTILGELGTFVQNNQETEGLKILELALQRPELLKILSSIFVPTKTSPNNFIKMYKFIIDSHMKRCDTKVLFVLLSKFDLPSWLQNTRPKLADISVLLKLIISGLENWNHVESSLLQDLFRRHLTHIFEFDFPEHYGEVLQIVLSGISEQKLMPVVIVDLLNSLTCRFGCEPFSLEMSSDKISEISTDFATKQNLFNYKASVETISIFTRHFQAERLQHGLNGLYPKHKNYCEALSIWFTCFGHVAVVTAICAYPGVLADQISDSIFACIVDLYSPWLITYTEKELQGQTANWIKELIHNGKVLYPWSSNYASHAKIMCLSFMSCVKYVLESLPISHNILGHVFSWYVHNFSINLDGHIYNVVHDCLSRLPWARFYPQAVHLTSFQSCLQMHLPVNHKFLGQIFIRIPWHDWMLKIFMSWPIQTQGQIISQLLTIYVQISFEPHLHNNIQLSKILEDSVGFPWFQVQFQGLEYILNWVVKTVDPTIVLRIPQESNYADRAVLDLLKISSGMVYSSTPEFTNNHHLQAKRICYTRSIVKLLRLCCAKNPRLIDTKEGLSAMKSAIIELLDSIEKIAQKSSGSREEREKEVQNLMMEICGSIQTQGEQTSRIFVDAMVIWQSECCVGSFVLSRTLSSFSLCKTLILGVYNLFEATIYNYFRHTDESLKRYIPSWTFIMNSLQPIVDKMDILTLVKGQYFLTLHTFILCKMKTFKSVGEKITFMDDVLQLLDSLKVEQVYESKLIFVYGVIISVCCQILVESENVQKTLLRMARHFQVQAQQVESWGEGLLGAIGLKKDVVTNRRRIVLRSLSCLIFALFPDRSNEEPASNQEFKHYLADLKTLWNHKKYSDVQSELTKCIEVINSSFFVTPYEAPSKILEMIGICYSNNFMYSVEEVWKVTNTNIS